MPTSPLCSTRAAPNASNSALLIGLVCGSYSACHCTPIAKAGASAMRIASIVPSSAMPSSETRLPGSRMPWPCSELTRIDEQPSSRAKKPSLASATSWRSANTTFGSGWKSPFSSRGARWFMRPGSSRISGCSEPPKATFISCRPRQTPNSGTPRSTQARIRPAPWRRAPRRRARAWDWARRRNGWDGRWPGRRSAGCRRPRPAGHRHR